MAVCAESLLADIQALWADLGAEEGVMRACSMTLIAVGDASLSNDALAALMERFPCRAIVIRVGEGPLAARVTAQCWTPQGTRRHICCEFVEIDTSLETAEQAVAPLAGLIAADLPVLLWCAGGHSPQEKWLAPAVALAGRVVVDTARAPSLADIAALRERGIAVSDLNWTRLRAWRQALAQAFDPAEYRAALHGEVEASIECGQARVAACYLRAWLDVTLGRAIATRIADTADAGIATLHVWAGDLHAKVARTAGGLIQTTTCDGAAGAWFTPETDVELLAEELTFAGADTLYDRVLRRALELARSDGEGG